MEKVEYISLSPEEKIHLSCWILHESSIPNIKAVFCDTWMEYPSLRGYVNTFPNVNRVKPDMLLKDIIDRFGWCFPSKDVSEMIWAARNGKQWAINKLNGLDKNGKPSEYRKQYIKWNKLCWDSDILISPYCCIEQKEKPVRRYERETGRHPILGCLHRKVPDAQKRG